MIRVTLIIRQTEITRKFPNGFQPLLEDNASILDAIRAADEQIKKKCGKLPAEKFKSLLHMVYNPYENRFYKQVAVQAHSRETQFLNLRENPKMILQNETTIILIPFGGCQTDWGEPVDF